MSLEESEDGSQRRHDFRVKPGHRNGKLAAATAPQINRGRVWFWAFFSGLLAAVVGWVIGERVNGSRHWERRVQAGRGDLRNQRARPPAEMLIESHHDAEIKQTALSMGILGAAVGLTLGMGGGLSRRSPRAAAVSGLTGWLLGTMAGTVVPLQLLPWFYVSAFGPPHPAFPALVHTSIYAGIGGVGGLVFGGGLRGPSGAARGLLAGALGAILGAIAYNVVHTIAFPLEWDLSPMPGRGMSRLLAHFCATLSSAVCIVLATDESLRVRRPGKASIQ